MKNKFEEQYFKVGRVVKVADGTYYLITEIELPDGYGRTLKYINLENGDFEPIPNYNKDGLTRSIHDVHLDVSEIYKDWMCRTIIFTNSAALIEDHMKDAEDYEEKCYQREALRESLNKVNDEMNDLYYKLMKED